MSIAHKIMCSQSCPYTASLPLVAQSCLGETVNCGDEPLQHRYGELDAVHLADSRITITLGS